MKTATAMMALATLAGCGGSESGGGGGGGTAAPAPTPTIPTLAVSLSATLQTTSIGDDGLGIPARLHRRGIRDDQRHGRRRFAVRPYAAGAGWRRHAGKRRQLCGAVQAGFDAGDGQLRRHRNVPSVPDTACATTYPRSTQTFTYRLTSQIADWTTYQRNPAHTGYVRATFDTAVFRKAWDWWPATTTRVSTIASANGLAYVTSQERDGTAMLRALASGTGEQRWSYAIGTTTYFSPPAMGNGSVFVTTMSTSSSENPILSVDAITGEYTPPRSLFEPQWSTFLQPVPYKDGLYMSAGYYGGVVYGFDYTTRTALGTETKGNVWGGETPAVDDATVYYHWARHWR